MTRHRAENAQRGSADSSPKKRVVAALLAVCALAATAGSGCDGRRKPDAEGSRPQGPPIEVATAAASRQGGGVVEVAASIRAGDHAVLAPRHQSMVLDLPYRVGESVAAHAVVARLDDAALRAAVAAADAAVRASDAEEERTERLLSRDAATPREMEDAAARAAAARAQLQSASEDLSYAVLRAPFAGKVAALPVHVGDVVSPGTPVVEIEGEGRYEVWSSVDAAMATGLTPGMTLSAVVDGLETPLLATIRAVGAGADPTTHRVELRADLPRTEGLSSGLFARLRIAMPMAEARITVPARAVFERGGLTGVFVVENGVARLRWVALGDRVGDRIEVRSGLRAGERVALNASALADGARVVESRAQGEADSAAHEPPPETED